MQTMKKSAIVAAAVWEACSSTVLSFQPAGISGGSSSRLAFDTTGDMATSAPFTHDSSNTKQMEEKVLLGTLMVPSVEEVVQKAIQLDGSFFDTAERYGSHAKTALGMGYGETERLTRTLLEKTAPSSPAIVATKFTPTPWRRTVKSVVDACQQSSNNLGVETIDLYQIHMPDVVQPFRSFLGEQPKDAIYWDGLAECYHRGLVKNVGVSNYGPSLMLQAQEALGKRGVPLASNQIAYSLIGRKNGAQGTVDVCTDSGVAVLAAFPYAMGLLTGKYSSSSNTKFVSNGKTALERLDLQRYAKGDGKMIPSGGLEPLLKAMETIAFTREKTVSQVALNYLLCKGTIPIPGARTAAQLEDNLGARGWRLSELEVEKLENAADGLGFDFEGAGFKRTGEKFVGYGVEKWCLN